MGSIMSLLNFTWPVKAVPFAGALGFELRQDDSSKAYYIQVLHKDNEPNQNISYRAVQIKGAIKKRSILNLTQSVFV